MNKIRLTTHIVLGAIAFALLCLSIGNTSTLDSAPPSKPPTWKSYWRDRGVTPPPPRDFLEGEYTGKVLNLTNGKLTDAVARKWALANLRRLRGDSWAALNLRLDVANAGVLGPPGLNGTDRGIKSELARNVVRIEGKPYSEVVVVAVIEVTKEEQAKERISGLTDYVIVLLHRTTGNHSVRVFRDGHTEKIDGGKAGVLSWQIDTGSYRMDPVAGPLWYQLRGWGCVPNDGSVVGKICGRVKP